MGTYLAALPLLVLLLAAPALAICLAALGVSNWIGLPLVLGVCVVGSWLSVLCSERLGNSD